MTVLFEDKLYSVYYFDRHGLPVHVMDTDDFREAFDKKREIDDGEICPDAQLAWVKENDPG